MFSKNTQFFILKNRKQKIVFDCQTRFLSFLLWRIENCSQKQPPNRPLVIFLFAMLFWIFVQGWDVKVYFSCIFLVAKQFGFLFGSCAVVGRKWKFSCLLCYFRWLYWGWWGGFLFLHFFSGLKSSGFCLVAEKMEEKDQKWKGKKWTKFFIVKLLWLWRDFLPALSWFLKSLHFLLGNGSWWLSSVLNILVSLIVGLARRRGTFHKFLH